MEDPTPDAPALLPPPLGAAPGAVTGSATATAVTAAGLGGSRAVPWYLRAWLQAQAFLGRHGRQLWWVHSVYALGLGLSVVLFARKGFAHARWLTLTLGAAWLLVVVFFHRWGNGERVQRARANTPGTRLQLVAMTYVLKNLYQGMLFFALPFYWSSATRGASNRWFVLLVGVLAVLSTLDAVFDRFLMRWRALAGVFHAMTIFTALHLVVPALLPGTRTLWVLLAAAALAVVAFWTLHAPAGSLREWRYQLALGLSVVLGTGAAWAARRVIPPVPMYTVSAQVGESTLPDGRLATVLMEAHRSVAPKLVAVTDVAVPGGRGDALVHVWRDHGVERLRVTEGSMEQRRVSAGVLRLRSSMALVRMPPHPAGPWTVDVETADGQLVGRATFTITE
ncbi:MAG: DUF2914 domain-containing protein [Deltaproteobacteria bacterium]|nr:DUF2914 domain-containing protein [Deltaproteobacteria bacterium]